MIDCVYSSKDEDWKRPALLSAPWGPSSDRPTVYGGDGRGFWWHHGHEQGYLWWPGLSALPLSSLAAREQPHCHFGSQARQSGKEADMERFSTVCVTPSFLQRNSSPKMKIIYPSPCHSNLIWLSFLGETCKEHTGYMNECIEGLHDFFAKIILQLFCHLLNFELWYDKHLISNENIIASSKTSRQNEWKQLV